MQPDLPSYWYQRHLHPSLYLLLPFSWLFGCIARLRRGLYRLNLLKTTSFAVPVIVVGNITVGGTGKTPLTIALAKILIETGFTPGIVSRGVGGKNVHTHRVSLFDLAKDVGDEALLLARETACPVVIAKNRVNAVRMLLQTTSCDVVISDDGLQHYRLQRTVEVAVVDGVRYFGNGKLLPAGPLREPQSRLQQVDFIIVNSASPLQYALLPSCKNAIYQMTIQPDQLISLKDKNQTRALEHFMPRKVHAVAAIGHPQTFFNALQQAGFDVQANAFPDHYLYRLTDFQFNDSLPIIMTAKDAVKCEDFCDARFWYLSTTTILNDQFKKDFLARLNRLAIGE